MLLAGLIAAATLAAATPPASAPELFLPEVIATEGSEVKPAFTPDGNCVFWGSIPQPADGQGFDILYSCRVDGQWAPARKAPFDTAANEFDPGVSTDGKTVWFFSNRDGGFGKDDIWSVSFDQRTLTFGEARNAGPNINSAGAEWAPVPISANLILFATDGRGGQGKHDLFFGWINGSAPPLNLGEIVNSAEDDFDPAYFDGVIVFARGDAEAGKADLFRFTPVSDGHAYPPVRLPRIANCSDELNIGPGSNLADPDHLYVSAYCPSIGKGRMDIFRVPLAGLAGLRPPAPSR